MPRPSLPAAPPKIEIVSLHTIDNCDSLILTEDTSKPWTISLGKAKDADASKGSMEAIQ